jgi:hypothetical protein
MAMSQASQSNRSNLPLEEAAADFFAKSGPLPPSFDDVRRHPRFYFRTCAEVTIRPLGKQKAPPAQCFVLTRDLSRSGLSLLHCEQLFPGQRIDVTLNGQPPRAVEVVWCYRQAKKTFVVGCRFLKSDE